MSSEEREKLIHVIKNSSLNKCKSLYELKLGGITPTLICDSVRKDSYVKSASLGDTTVYLMQCVDNAVFQESNQVSALEVINNENYDSADPDEVGNLLLELNLIKRIENKYNMTYSEITEMVDEKGQIDESILEGISDFYKEFMPIMTKVGNGPLQKNIDIMAGMEISDLVDLYIDRCYFSFLDGGTRMLILNRDTGKIFSTEIIGEKFVSNNTVEVKDGLLPLFDSSCPEFDYMKDGYEYIYKNNQEVCIGEEGSITLRQYYRNLDLIFKGDYCIGESDLYLLTKDGEYQYLASGVSLAEVLEDDSILYISNGELILYKDGLRKLIDEGASMFWSISEQEPSFKFSNAYNDTSWTETYLVS